MVRHTNNFIAFPTKLLVCLTILGYHTLELKNTLLANINLIDHMKTRARSMEIASLHNSK